MTETALTRRRAWVDAFALTVGILGTLAYVETRVAAYLLVGAYGLLVGTGTLIVTCCLLWFTGPSIAKNTDGDEADSLHTRMWHLFTGGAIEGEAETEEDTGWLIGRVENVLVLTLIFADAFTALSIIFAAKSWVRYEDTASSDSTYYLAGTLVNFTYSTLLGLVIVTLLQ